jgi:beta-glucanase (GH16 family)
VHKGVLTLTAARDRRLGGRWGTGGVCQCGHPRTYGAFFVHSRVTGAGPDEIDLLWPVAHVWPPEIDFNESVSHASSTTWTVHFGVRDHVVYGAKRIDLEQWHTWGVIWTRRSVRLVVDGRTWGMVTARHAVPAQPMTLDISQQTFCGLTAACPTHTVRMEVDWVAEYTAT